MFKKLICIYKGHDFHCRLHNFIKIEATDQFNFCIVRCLRCFKNLEIHIHYGERCGYGFGDRGNHD
jgi:hypothetical protein